MFTFKNQANFEGLCNTQKKILQILKRIFAKIWPKSEMWPRHFLKFIRRLWTKNEIKICKTVWFCLKSQDLPFWNSKTTLFLCVWDVKRIRRVFEQFSNQANNITFSCLLKKFYLLCHVKCLVWKAKVLTFLKHFTICSCNTIQFLHFLAAMFNLQSVYDFSCFKILENLVCSQFQNQANFEGVFNTKKTIFHLMKGLQLHYVFAQELCWFIMSWHHFL